MTDRLYLSPTDEKENCCLQIGDLYFRQIEVSEDTGKQIEEQMADWEIHIFCQWYREDLSRNDIRRGETTEVIPVKDIIARKGSDEIAGASFIVEGSQFAGVIIQYTTYSGFGMWSESGLKYCIFRTNGETVGNRSDHSGHCSTEVDEWSDTVYSLKRKE